MNSKAPDAEPSKKGISIFIRHERLIDSDIRLDILIHSADTKEILPPRQEPAMSAPQFRINCIESEISKRATSGDLFKKSVILFIRDILILSARLDMAACAQQEPQYTGRCWFFGVVMKEVPSILDHENLNGSFSLSIYSAGSGRVKSSRRV